MGLAPVDPILIPDTLSTILASVRAILIKY